MHDPLWSGEPDAQIWTMTADQQEKALDEKLEIPKV